MDSTQLTPSLCGIGRDLQRLVLSHIDSPADMMHGAQTCKAWRTVLDSPQAWLEILRRNFPSAILPSADNAKETYRQWRAKLNHSTGPDAKSSLLTSAAVKALCLSQNHLVAGLDDGSVRMWTRGTLQLGMPLRQHAGAVNCLVTDGDTVFSGGIDGKVVRYDLTKHTAEVLYEGGAGKISKMTCTSSRLIAGTSVGRILIWDAADLKKPRVLNASTKEIRCLQVYKNRLLYAVDEALCSYDLDSAVPVPTDVLEPRGCVTQLLLQDQLLYVSRHSKSDGSVFVWNLETNQLHLEHRAFKSEIRSLAIHRQQLTAGYSDGPCVLWNLGKSLLVDRSDGHTNVVYSIVGADGLLLSSSWDQTLSIFNVATRKNLPEKKLGGSGREIVIDQGEVFVATFQGLVHFE